MKPAYRFVFTVTAAVAAVGSAFVHQERAWGGTGGVGVEAAGPGSRATFESGIAAGFESGIAAGAQVTGVTVLNGEVWIDGEKVPPEATRFTGRSGKTYRIERTGERNGAGVRVRAE